MSGSAAPLVLGVSEFVAFFNQTIAYAYPHVVIEGELANLRVSKNTWVYFDLKDEVASVRFFGSVHVLPGPLEEGMMLKVTGVPQLHQQYGFSVTVESIQLTGKGSIKKAAQLLQSKLQKEGLFDASRKRTLPYPPASIGLITSGQSAAYTDFIKIVKARWGWLNVQHYDVQVQGDSAPAQIVQAVEYFNSHASPVEVLVITRGGGSADNLQAFSTESVTRSIAASRVPTLVAIGHEADISLAELAADRRASTPSNAAELLVPDKTNYLASCSTALVAMEVNVKNIINQVRSEVDQARKMLDQFTENIMQQVRYDLVTKKRTLALLDPHAALRRGYALVSAGGRYVTPDTNLSRGDDVDILLYKNYIKATITLVKRNPKT